MLRLVARVEVEVLAQGRLVGVRVDVLAPAVQELVQAEGREEVSRSSMRCRQGHVLVKVVLREAVAVPLGGGRVAVGHAYPPAVVVGDGLEQVAAVAVQDTLEVLRTSADVVGLANPNSAR